MIVPMKYYFPIVASGLVLVMVLAAFTIQFARSTAEPDTVSVLPVPEAMRAQVYFDIGQYYFDGQDHLDAPYDLTRAREYYTRAAELDPRVDERLWYQFGRLEFIEGNLDASLQKFARQMELFGEDLPNVLYMKGLAYGYKARRTNDPEDWKQAELAFKNFLPYAPGSPWTRVDLAWVYFSQGKYDEMKPVLEEGLTLRSGQPWLLNMYGLALMNTGDPAAAVDVFARAQASAAELTVSDWAEAYPGNHPELWGDGLSEFRSVISTNLQLARTQQITDQ